MSARSVARALALNEASPLNRRRATTAEMEERARFLIEYSKAHGPTNVRGLYYQAEVRKLPGIGKDERDYDKIQRHALRLRREGRIDYEDIADATRWMRKPRSHDSIEQALADTAALYRKALWTDADVHVEVWCEKDALAGVILPVTSAYDVPLMVSRGYVSESFAYEAVAARGDDRRPFVVYYCGDFDRAGVDAARSLQEKLDRFGAEAGITVSFETIAVTRLQVAMMRLPTRAPKRATVADRKWPYDYACELDAIPPDTLRQLVEAAINRHLPQEQLRILRIAEEDERRLLRGIIGMAERKRK